MNRKLNSRRGRFSWMNWVGIVIVAFLVMGVAWVIRERRSRMWEGEERFTLVRVGNNVIIESIDPASREAVRLKLPEKLEIETVGGRGKWRVNVLGQMALKYGWVWVGDSVTDFLGISYTGIEADMNIWDRLNWWRLAKSAQWDEIELDESSLVSESTGVDGENLLGLSSRWDQKAKILFTSLALSELDTGVKVVNTTTVSGLGSHVARVVESSGMRVVRVESAQDREMQKCEVRGNPNQKNKLGARFLVKSFGCLWKNSDVGDNELTLVVGREYQNWWLGEE